MRVLVYDSHLGYIVKDFAIKRQCIYGNQEYRATIAFIQGFDMREDICIIEALTPTNQQTNILKTKG